MYKKALIILGVILVSVTLFYAYVAYSNKNNLKSFTTFSFGSTPVEKETPVPAAVQEKKHIEKPENVKGIYMSSWVAGTKSIRDRLTNLVKDTELNSIIIDFKDSTGVVSIPSGANASQSRINASSKRAVDLPEYIKELHSHGIYTIARIAVFQDPVYAKNNPNTAVQNSSGSVWKDKHGLSWVDPSNEEFYKYIIDLADEAHSIGFDEINFDYIRFPTDGTSDRIFPISKSQNKQSVITNFLSYVHADLKSKNIPMSIDVFGQIVSTSDDMGIGQYYEEALVNTDAIAPMIYPSHFYPGYKNLKSPESSPYETIRLSMEDAINRKNAINSNTELRPWIQDFSLAVNYDASMVKAQIKALNDLGIESYLVWDPKNKYTKEAFMLETSN
jgi:hypothetical protein